MKINSICKSLPLGVNNYQINNDGFNKISDNKYGLRLNPQLNIDTVSFTAKIPNLSVTEKMKNYAIALLEKHNFKEGQILYAEGNSSYLPFMNTLVEEAYKKGAKNVELIVKEPELEALKKKYNIKESFGYIKDMFDELKEAGALILKFDKANNPYRKAAISNAEAKAEYLKLTPQIPTDIRKKFELNPEEIFKTALDIHKGQPVYILGEREHLPNIIKLVDYLYSKNNTRLVEVKLGNNERKSFYQHAKDEYLDYVSKFSVAKEKEFLDKDVAYLRLEGRDPEEFAGLDTERIVRAKKAYYEAVEEYLNQSTSNVPWLVYYAPTTKSALAAYPEFGKDGLKALNKALEDAKQINRVGKLEEHINNLDFCAKKMNELMDKGYRTLHYVSVDSVTKLPDGKTDFKVTMSPKSIFQAARMEMKKFGHNPIVNVPTEEVFTAPQANTAEGIISATMPLNLNGQIVDGIQFRFKEGKIIDVKATLNEEMLKHHIAANKNADRLGEVAIVADSPIKKLNRLFKETLLDENASCHLAIGDAYPETVKGAAAIEDYAAQKNYLKELNINSSPTHVDFMVGGENLQISAINPLTGDSIVIVKDDKFVH